MLINCPECGKQVSDKAEVCPHCGIKIAGAIQQPQYRPQYTQPQQTVPTIGQQTQYTQPQQPQYAQPQQGQYNPMQSVGEQPRASQPNTDQQQPEELPKKSNKVIYISVVIAILILGAGYYFYTGAQEQKEQDAYEYAMQSTDPIVLQDYLAKYMDAPLEHRDSVTAHLMLLQQGDEAWQNALASGSKGALKQYIEENPNSPHVTEAKNKIDSLDYATAQRLYKANNDMSALQQYLTEHPDGRYAEEVSQLVGDAQNTQVSQAELSFAKGVCRKFFQAINAKDANKLVSTVSDILGSFLNRSGATSDDVVNFMNKLYKDDITNMNWHIGDDFTGTKVDDGMGGKNIQVQFSAVQNIERTDPNKEKVGNYIISAEITQDGHITKFNMKKKVAQ